MSRCSAKNRLGCRCRVHTLHGSSFCLWHDPALVIAYQMLQRREPYQDLGSTYYDERQKQVVANRYVRRLEKLGYTVKVTEPALAKAVPIFISALPAQHTCLDTILWMW